MSRVQPTQNEIFVSDWSAARRTLIQREDESDD